MQKWRVFLKFQPGEGYRKLNLQQSKEGRKTCQFRTGEELTAWADPLLRYKMVPNSSDTLQTSTGARGKLKVVEKAGRKVPFHTGKAEEKTWLDGAWKRRCVYGNPVG